MDGPSVWFTDSGRARSEAILKQLLKIQVGKELRAFGFVAPQSQGSNGIP